MSDRYCPHCGINWYRSQKNPVCEDCYDAMTHFQPPTRRPIHATLVIDAKEQSMVIGYYDVNTGEITPLVTKAKAA